MEIKSAETSYAVLPVSPICLVSDKKRNSQNYFNQGKNKQKEQGYSSGKTGIVSLVDIFA